MIRVCRCVMHRQIRVKSTEPAGVSNKYVSHRILPYHTIPLSRKELWREVVGRVSLLGGMGINFSG